VCIASTSGVFTFPIVTVELDDTRTWMLVPTACGLHERIAPEDAMRRGALLLFVLLLHTPSARADPIPIRITGGSLDLSADQAGGIGLPNFDIVGTRDFRLTEFVEASTGFGFPCRPCAPGDLLNPGGKFAEDFGSATLAGVSYAIPGEAGIGSSFFAQGVVAPAFASSGILTAPFTYQGFFTIVDPSAPRQFVLLGQGVATIRLQRDNRDPSRPLWEFGGTHLDFRMAPTPEPPTLLLLGSGLLAAVVWRRMACPST
jgi:PEP-CTERM motif-containing protein